VSNKKGRDWAKLQIIPASAEEQSQPQQKNNPSLSTRTIPD